MNTTTQQNSETQAPAATEARALLHITNELGMQISIPVSNMTDAYAKMRQFGRGGWSSGNLPVGGLKLPYAMADTFDWSLIGAREATIEGEHGVWYRNQFYKRRDLQATKKIAHPAVKYSRGATPGDPPEVREKADGDIEYVTLARFSGNGPRNELFCKPTR